MEYAGGLLSKYGDKLMLPTDAVAAGVVVRPFAGDGVRVTVTNAAEDDVFLQFAESWDGPRS